ncbi:hypothetical protein ACHWQZ_G014166 [Mnemiopsis leidyi]
MYRHTIFCAVAVILSGVLAEKAPSFSKDCFNITGVISFNVTYKMADDKLNSYVVKLSDKAAVTDYNCTQTAVSATIKEGSSSLVVQFGINPNKSKHEAIDPEHWGVTQMTYNYLVDAADANPKGMRQATAVGSFFVTPINHTYSCRSQSLNLENVTMGSGNETVHLADEFVLFEETGLLISVGPNQTTDSDYDYHYCKADQKVKDIVPIAVGVALAALVVIVLIAYLIGRRRTVAAGGYERV